MKKLAIVIASTITLAIQAMATDPADGYDGEKVIKIAEAEQGQFKAPGADDARVKEYVTTTFQNDDEYTGDGWCSAFVSWVLKQAGYKYSPENTDYGWMWELHRVEADKVKVGDIAMMDSHITFVYGFLTSYDGQKMIKILGGNQDYQVCVMTLPVRDILYFARSEPAPEGWMPQKHIPTASGGANINVLDDRFKWSSSSPHHTTEGHPL